jgi:hypothetical protein
VFLLERDVEKHAVLDDRTAEGRARTIPVEVGRSVLRFERIARIQSAVLQEKEGIAVDLVRAYTRDDIDGAAGCAARFSRQTGVDHLEFLNGFERELSATGAYEFIIVVETVDGHIVAAPSKTTECEAAVGQRC